MKVSQKLSFHGTKACVIKREIERKNEEKEDEETRKTSFGDEKPAGTPDLGR